MSRNVITEEQARQRDWLCRCWVESRPKDQWCVTTGRISGYQMGEEWVPGALVLFNSHREGPSLVPLEHLEVHNNEPAIGLLNSWIEGEKTAWWAGWQDAKAEEEGYIG